MRSNRKLGPFFTLLILLGVATLATFSGAEAQRTRETPYWASIASGKAMMRTGPGQTFPATWLYQRADLPIKVLEVYQNWRKIQDPDGTVGWMMVSLLSDTRTAIVRGEAPQPLHEEADARSPVRFRAEPGVVGRISRCSDGWCHLDVRGRGGYIRADHIWGINRGEKVD
jgi:SH3-like domain-containing protein